MSLSSSSSSSSYKQLYLETKAKYNELSSRYPSVIITVPGTFVKCGVNFCGGRSLQQVTCESCGEVLCKYHQTMSRACKYCYRMRCTKTCALRHSAVCGALRNVLLTE